MPDQMILCFAVVATVVRPIFCGLHHPSRWRPRQGRTDENASAGQTLDLNISSRRNLIKLLTDPYNAKKLAEELANEHGLPVECNRQGYLSLSDPTKTLHEHIMARKIRHCGNPILRWHASNAVARQDAAGNLKLDKAKSRKKIDGMAALVNAVAGAINYGEGPSVFRTRKRTGSEVTPIGENGFSRCVRCALTVASKRADSPGSCVRYRSRNLPSHSLWTAKSGGRSRFPATPIDQARARLRPR